MVGKIISKTHCSVGIIGGADGPVNFWVSSSDFSDYILIGVLALVLTGLILLYFYVKKKRK